MDMYEEDVAGYAALIALAASLAALSAAQESELAAAACSLIAHFAQGWEAVHRRLGAKLCRDFAEIWRGC